MKTNTRRIFCWHVWHILGLQVASCIFYLFTFFVGHTFIFAAAAAVVVLFGPCFKYVPTLIEHFNHKKIDHLTSEIGCA